MLRNWQKVLSVPIPIYVGLIAYVCLIYAVFLLDEAVLRFLVTEDSVFETITWISLFLTALLFLYTLVVLRKRATQGHPLHIIKQSVYVALVVLFLFGAGEEISWGQRFFGIETPAAFENNVQGEITLHNFPVATFLPDFVTVARMFTLFAMTFTLAIPVASTLFEPAERFFSKLMPVPPWSLGVLFLLNYIAANATHIVFRSLYVENPLLLNPTEIKESVYAFLFVVVAAHGAYVARTPDDSSA